MKRPKLRTDAKEPTERSEFDRFEELTRKLVKVPKPEIDAERATHNQNGEQHRAP